MKKKGEKKKRKNFVFSIIIILILIVSFSIIYVYLNNNSDNYFIHGELNYSGINESQYNDLLLFLNNFSRYVSADEQYMEKFHVNFNFYCRNNKNEIIKDCIVEGDINADKDQTTIYLEITPYKNMKYDKDLLKRNMDYIMNSLKTILGEPEKTSCDIMHY